MVGETRLNVILNILNTRAVSKTRRGPTRDGSAALYEEKRQQASGPVGSQVSAQAQRTRALRSRKEKRKTRTQHMSEFVFPPLRTGHGTGPEFQ